MAPVGGDKESGIGGRAGYSGALEGEGGGGSCGTSAPLADRRRSLGSEMCHHLYVCIGMTCSLIQLRQIRRTKNLACVIRT